LVFTNIQIRAQIEKILYHMMRKPEKTPPL
jgi:hypothetical protein